MAEKTCPKCKGDRKHSPDKVCSKCNDTGKVEVKKRGPRQEQPNWLLMAEYFYNLSAENLPFPQEIVKVLRGFGMVASQHPEVTEYVKSLPKE